MSMALSERFGLGYDAYTGYRGAIEAVGAEDVRQVAKRYLPEDGLLEVIVGPV